MNNGFFITGTDTGVGKTVVAATIAYALHQRHINFSYIKPVESGISSREYLEKHSDAAVVKRAGFLTEPLKEICTRENKPELAVAIGPAIMMKFCCETTRPFDVHTVVSLNTIMVDGTGMCGGCRVEVGGKTKFVCVDGPEFDGHKVNFDLMMKRLGAYKAQEQKAHQEYLKHRCKVGLND